MGPCLIRTNLETHQHWRRKVLNIWEGGKFRILGAKDQNIGEYRGGGGGGGGGGAGGEGGTRGAKLFAGCKLIGAPPAPNQCQIITFLTLQTDDIAKLRIELKSILLETFRNTFK